MQGIGRTIKMRRRRGKTDYKARLRLLKSDKPRVVIRKTNRFIIGQIVVSDVAQDRVVVGVNSKDLLGSGWPKELSGSLKNRAASYLTGYMLGKKSKEIKEGVLDMGLQRNVKHSRAYAFLKGLIDSGFKVPHSEDVVPKEEHFSKDEKMEKLISELKEKIK